jgi:DNA-3-methyladenine glycosylase
MFHPGGTAYVYLCYGVHSLFNVVISGEGVPNAVLVRSIKPLRGIDAMIQRTGKAFMDRNSGTGPGNTAKLLGIHYSHSGIDLCRTPDSHQHDFIWIRDEGFLVPESEIATGPRIGVAYAAEDALLPYRFVWNWK